MLLRGRGLTGFNKAVFKCVSLGVLRTRQEDEGGGGGGFRDAGSFGLHVCPYVSMMSLRVSVCLCVSLSLYDRQDPEAFMYSTMQLTWLCMCVCQLDFKFGFVHWHLI